MGHGSGRAPHVAGTASARAGALAVARALGEQARACAEQGEHGRCLPPALAAALAQSGLGALAMPARHGGLEADPLTLAEVVEIVARGDGSAGWCVAIAATSGLVGGYLGPAAAAEVCGPHAVLGGVYAPLGRAERTAFGYRVSGRWPFVSGCRHATHLMGGALVAGEDTARAAANRLMIVPASEAAIEESWEVQGLRGTGSDTLVLDDVPVPAERSVALLAGPPREPGPLYAFPVFGLLAVGIAAAALGIARGAIDDLTDLATVKTPSHSSRRLAERAAVQSELAEAEAAVRSARAMLHEEIGACWERATAAGALSPERRALLRLAATNATQRAAEAVDRMYAAGGASAIYLANGLQRRFRDVHVATQHVMVSPQTRELVGRVLLGLKTDASLL